MDLIALTIFVLMFVFLYYMIRILILSLDHGLKWFFPNLFIPFFIYVYCLTHWEHVEKFFMRGHIVLIVLIALFGYYTSTVDVEIVKTKGISWQPVE